VASRNTVGPKEKDRRTGPSDDYLRLWRLALRRLRYLCFDIFLRRFLTSDPIQKPHIKGEKTPLIVASFPR